MTSGDSSRPSAKPPTSQWVDGDCSRQSAALPTSLWVVGIVVALPEELSTLTGHKPAQGECLAIADNILLAYSGAGPINAGKSANFLIGKGVDGLISWGCAAALSSDLNPGDLVIPEQILSEQRLAFSTDKAWLQHLRQCLLPEKLTLTTGSLAESSRIVADSGEKQLTYRQTGAVALDMESAAVIKAAQQANIPCLAIRAIVDPAGMDLPRAVVQSLNAQGRTELPKLLRFLLTHPWEIPALIKLGLNFNAARKTLKIVAKQLNILIDFKNRA